MHVSGQTSEVKICERGQNYPLPQPKRPKTKRVVSEMISIYSVLSIYVRERRVKSPFFTLQSDRRALHIADTHCRMKSLTGVPVIIKNTFKVWCCRCCCLLFAVLLLLMWLSCVVVVVVVVVMIDSKL